MAEENKKEGETGFSTKLRFQIQSIQSKILSVLDSISNERQRKLHIHSTGVFASLRKSSSMQS